MITARRVHVTGIVQGVGFRPFLARLADRCGVTGWVHNTGAGVEMVIEGAEERIAAFLADLQGSPPPLARIVSLSSEPVEPDGCTSFQIRPSGAGRGDEIDAPPPVPPDVAVCEACLKELFDPEDRRYRYPFLNCTDCGPRYTIIEALPYDRAGTTMAGFPLCEACAAEYADPLDRRFHAQPTACPRCGPRLALWTGEEGKPQGIGGEEALQQARRIIAAGGIVAVKGLGGYHLACSALREQAVLRLRERKRRWSRPFALMACHEQTIARHAEVTPEQARLLAGPERPIVLLERRSGSPVAAAVSPGLRRIGFMLPYTPLHYLLLEPAPDFPEVVVMTSGNLSDEPIAFEQEDARRRLAGIADAFLTHDRPIMECCDDSVLASCGSTVTFYRRSRGWTPRALPLPFTTGPVVAAGGDLKNTFCLARGAWAWPSAHIGELHEAETMVAFERALAHMERIFHIRPERLVHDLHPDYRSTRWALERGGRQGLPTVAVQHHHAHIAGVLAEHGLDPRQRVIGVAFDGTGYGTDGTIWGGEFLLASCAKFERAAWLRPIPMPGGEAAVRAPWRMALAWLHLLDLPLEDDLAPVQAGGPEGTAVVTAQLAAGFNAPITTSMGRLFDAAAALCGLRQVIDYEAQAACEFEAIADPLEQGAYPFDAGPEGIDPAAALTALIQESRRGIGRDQIAARFHNGLAIATAEVCAALRDKTGLQQVALSGGVWQNGLLAERTRRALQARGFAILEHIQLPVGDGGLAWGQIAAACAPGANLHQAGEL